MTEPTNDSGDDGTNIKSPAILAIQPERVKTGFTFYDELPLACLEWYENHIDEPFRPLICYLRNAGVNTTECCAHRMLVFYDSQRIDHRRLETLMTLFFYLSGWENEGSWWIESKVVPDGMTRRWCGIITLYIPGIHIAYLEKEIHLHEAELSLYSGSPPLDPESDELYRTSTAERIGYIVMRLREDKSTLARLKGGNDGLFNFEHSRSAWKSDTCLT